MKSPFLLTPLREGRLSGLIFLDYFRPISTHAPAGGATSAAGKEIPTIGTISTHAPAGGATRAGPDLRGGCIDFYSRPCGRGDLDYWNMARREGLDFYSRPCGRGDCIPYIRYTSWFPISTHAPAGGATRSPLRWPGRCSPHFYSRPCGRGDMKSVLSVCGDVLISTHAPAGGATGYCCILSSNSSISTHAPAGGATQVRYDMATQACDTFLLTPLREGRLQFSTSPS